MLPSGNNPSGHGESRSKNVSEGNHPAGGASLFSPLAFAHKPAGKNLPIKLGLVTYLWGKDWDLPTLIKNCADTGLQGVELRVDHAHGVMPHLNATQREEVKKHFADSPVQLVGLGTNQQFDFVEPGQLKASIERTKEFIRLSADVGGSGVKVKPNALHREVAAQKTLTQIGESLNELARYGAELGQQIRLEVHGEETQELPTIKKIMDAATHPNATICWNCNPQDLNGRGFDYNFNLVNHRFGATCHVRELDRTDYPYQSLLTNLVKMRYTGWRESNLQLNIVRQQKQLAGQQTERNMITAKKPFLSLIASLLMLSSFAQPTLPVASTGATVYGNNAKVGKYADIRGFRMYYEVYGTGKPLLIIHGNGGSIKDFKHQIPYSAKNYQVILADSRTHGKSLDTSDSLTYEMMADDLNALLNKLRVDSCYVIGWSDGGIDGLLLAMRHPEKVKKLAITGANLWPDTTAVEPDLFQWIVSTNDSLATVSQTPAVKAQKKLLNLMVVNPHISTADLKQVRCPTLVIGGDNDVILPRHTMVIAQAIPQSYLWILPNSGHSTLIRYKEMFNQVVGDFFKTPYRKVKGMTQLE